MEFLQIIVAVVCSVFVTCFYWHRNPEKDVYQIAIDDLDKLSRKKRIVLYVDNNAHLSQD